MSHNLGIQATVTSSPFNHWSWIYLFVNVSLRRPPDHVLTWQNEKQRTSSHMHISTCLLQGIWGQLRSLGIGTLTKASTTHQTHQCVLSSLPRARALKENQDLSHRYQGTNCRHLNKGSPAEHFLPTLQVHVWTVTQDALVRECEVYCTAANSTSTMTLMLQPF